MSKIEIIPLAAKKIEQRKIPRKWIDETICLPVQIVDGYAGRKIRQKKYPLEGKDALLRVIAEEEAGKFVVVTAYLTTQIDRYWR